MQWWSYIRLFAFSGLEDLHHSKSGGRSMKISWSSGSWWILSLRPYTWKPQICLNRLLSEGTRPVEHSVLAAPAQRSDRLLDKDLITAVETVLFFEWSLLSSPTQSLGIPMLTGCVSETMTMNYCECLRAPCMPIYAVP